MDFGVLSALQFLLVLFVLRALIVCKLGMFLLAVEQRVVLFISIETESVSLQGVEM